MTGSCSTARLSVAAASCGRPRSSSDWPAPTSAGTCAGSRSSAALEGGVGVVEIALEQQVAAEVDQVFSAGPFGQRVVAQQLEPVALRLELGVASQEALRLLFAA